MEGAIRYQTRGALKTRRSVYWFTFSLFAVSVVMALIGIGDHSLTRNQPVLFGIAVWIAAPLMVVKVLLARLKRLEDTGPITPSMTRVLNNCVLIAVLGYLPLLGFVLR